MIGPSSCSRARRAGLDAAEQLGRLVETRPWYGTIDTGFAVAASARAGALAPAALKGSTVRITVADAEPRLVTIDDTSPVQRLTLDPGTAGRVRVQLQLVEGQRLDYAASLSGVVSDAPERTAPATVTQSSVLSDVPRRKGVALDEGFSALIDTSGESWQIDVTELALGDSARIQVQLRGPQAAAGNRESQPYELEIPLPAGAILGPDTGAEVTLARGSAFVPLDLNAGSRSVRLEIVGTDPGTYVMPPPALRSAVDPGKVSYGEATTLTVLGAGETSSDVYVATPDERISRGRAAFADREYDEVRGVLRPLFEERRKNLRPHALSEVARLLLFSSLPTRRAPDG